FGHLLLLLHRRRVELRMPSRRRSVRQLHIAGALRRAGRGTHTFSVRALDANGDPDPSPASQSFTVDQTPPETAIDSGPSGTVDTASVSFSFSSNEAGSTFECRVDAAPFVACASPASYSGLPQGGHTLEARAVADAGSIDPP